MIDLDLLDDEAFRKMQTLRKQRCQNTPEATTITLINQYFDVKTLEEEQAVLLGKYRLSKADLPR